MGVEPRASIEVRALIFTYAEGQSLNVLNNKGATSKEGEEMCGE